MNKYVVISLFLSIFFFLIRKERVYIVPFILIIYSNINGLIDWEDFALRGLIKFYDYGLILVVILIFYQLFIRKVKIYDYKLNVKSYFLYRAIIAYWWYYLFLFIYSIILQGNVEWPIKMGRTFFFGMIFFVIFYNLRSNPTQSFEKILNVLKVFTIIFGCMYIGYNLFGIDFYPKGEHESFHIRGMDTIKRNFSGFPTFTFYFIIFFVDRILTENKINFLNFFGFFVLITCVFLSLTRGTLVLTVVIIMLTVVLRRPSHINLKRLSIMLGLIVILTPIILEFSLGYYEALLQRFNEFDVVGIDQSSGYLVRAEEFLRIIDNVLDFNPLLGFGFTNISLLNLGYFSNVLYGGSPDNGFSNLIGTTGFLGFGIFLVVLILWMGLNIKLQALNKEPYSKINFLFIIFMLVSFLNGSSMSYMHSYALFLAYDLLAYSYYTWRIKQHVFKNQFNLK